MKKIKDSITVIGEGITEYYYFNSLKDDFRQLNIKPAYPKHSTGLGYLEQEIDKSIDAGYSLIICVIDMDNKKKEKKRIITLSSRIVCREFILPRNQGPNMKYDSLRMNVVPRSFSCSILLTNLVVSKTNQSCLTS